MTKGCGTKQSRNFLWSWLVVQNHQQEKPISIFESLGHWM
jgi:hypothetical protein